MPRFPTPWSKKRGERSLSGSTSGVVGEVAFFALLFLLGVFGLTLVLIHEFAPHHVSQVPTEALEGAVTEALQSDLSAWIFGVLSIAAIISGGTSLVVRVMRESASSERRSAMASRADQPDSAAASDAAVPRRLADEAVRLPNIPTGESLNDSPGERLTYRLAAEIPEHTLLGSATLTLLWNAAWFVLLAVVVAGFASGERRWIVAGLLIPFGWIGYWSFRRFLSQLRQRAGVGPTIVEISNHPLLAGDSYQLFLSQTGRFRLKRLTVQLVCDEETFYRQGTDLRVERYQSLCQVLWTQNNVVVDPQAPLEQQLEFTLPKNVMHSFVAAHNAIRWRIVVQGESRPWPSFCRSFPIIVHPPSLPTKRSPR
jgi:positive regulator of sigma E activity